MTTASSRLKASERMEIISEFITTGKCREGFSVIEDKNGRYRVRRLSNGPDQVLNASELEKRIHELQQQLASLRSGQGTPPTPWVGPPADKAHPGLNGSAVKPEGESQHDALPPEQ